MTIRKVVSWLLTVFAFLALSAFIWSERYTIHDWVVLRFYTPTAEAQELASTTAMTGLGKRLFYVNAPEIADSGTFNASCTHRERSIVLGCYNGTKIYIYNVTNPELQGVKEVTAAHEMLHAAYDRLDARERNRLKTLLEQAYQTSANERVKSLIASYNEQDPAIVPNELHSIIGTEVKTLSPELESYYAQYFTNRQKVVAYSERYESVFNKAKADANALLEELTALKTDIELREKRLDDELALIKQRRDELDAYRQSDQVDAYNALVPVYNSLVKAYNTDATTLKDLIDSYNTKVNTYNALALRQQELVRSIDSSIEQAE